MIPDEAPDEPSLPGAAGEVPPWAGLRSRFFAARPPDEQVHIFDLSVRTAKALYQWAARYPLIRRVRVWPLALSVSAASPFSSLDALISTTRLSLWVFTLDDLFDEERAPEKELLRRAERYRAVALGEPVAPSRDSLATALRDVREDLATYPLFGSLGHEWENALAGTIHGMVTEYHWRLRHRSEGASALPSYEDYIENGLYSIGGPPHVWAALITTGDPSTPYHLDHLRLMERAACTAIRLANDLRSYQKEIDEGNVNALVLISGRLIEQGWNPEEAQQEAEARVREAIRDGLRLLDDLQADRRTATGHPEADIADIARFVCDFYSEYDYHTFATTSRAG